MTLNQILGEGISSTSLKDVRELINHPFYKNSQKLFVNGDWQIIELENDFFIENENFEVLKQIMVQNGDSYFYVIDASNLDFLPLHKISIDSDIENIRALLSDYQYYTIDWYFISPNKGWACVSISDDSVLYVGFKKDEKIINTAKITTNFVRLLP